jgi:hypothetical protein
MSKLTLVLALFVLTAGCTSTGEKPISGPASSIEFIVPVELPPATIGEPYNFSFCQPDRALASDLCSGFETTDNPMGGQPPYHFALDSGAGFPPFGISLNLNGLLSGTPIEAGKRTFRVCAVDQTGTQSCQTTSLTVKGSISVNPDSLIIRAPICMKEPCKVSGSVVVSSTVPWHIGHATGHATARCFDPVAEFSRSWSICPPSGEPGDTVVEISTMVFGEATPERFTTLIKDRGATWRFEARDDVTVFAKLSAALELSKP